jgi:hypothetical protein
VSELKLLQSRNDFKSEALGLTSKMLAGGLDSPHYFCGLLMLLLKKTILDEKSFLSVQFGDSKTDFVIAPPSRKIQEIRNAADGSELFTPVEAYQWLFSRSSI